MPTFKLKDEYAPEPEALPLSANQQRLAALTSDRDEVQAEADAIEERIARLNAAKSEVDEINAELAEMNAREQADMLAWVSADDGSDAPSPDAARRQELVIALARATAKATAIDGATRSLHSQILATHEKLARLTPLISQMNALIAIDDLEAELPAMAAAVSEIERVKHVINSGFYRVAGMAHSLPADLRGPVSTRLEAFDKLKNKAGSVVPLAEPDVPPAAPLDPIAEWKRVSEMVV
jgi:chromosome segregation ATPase